MTEIDRGHGVRRGAAAIIALVFAACELPSSPGVTVPCEPDGSCAAGEICVAQVCMPEPSTCADAVTAGETHSCVIRSDHTAWCWGRNLDGQLGDGTSDDRTAPIQVLATTRFAAIAAGTTDTCAIDDDHNVWCWGHNAAGMPDDPIASSTPAQVANLAGVSAVGVGNAHRCALLEGGTVKCWGANSQGQLGNSSTAPNRVPGLVPVLGAIQEISVWRDTACAIDGNGVLSCWGSGGGGQLGEVSRRDTPTAMVVPPVAHVAVGQDFWCAVTVEGEVVCAGSNALGQLGVANENVRVPVVVPLPVRAAAIMAGDRFACATEVRDELHDPPRVWCWGQNSDAQLGDGLAVNHPTPTVTGYTGAVALAGGRAHLCALSASGGISCSGYNGQGQLGDGERTTQGAPPPPISGLTGVTSIAAGSAHTCAVADGNVLCWGRNAEGQLGDGTLSARVHPTRVLGIAGAVAVVAGRAHSCALLADRTAMCWGANQSGQLGSGLADREIPLPRPVLGGGGAPLMGITQIAVGADHSCALLEGGAVGCWGNNRNNQVGVAQEACMDCGQPIAVALPVAARELALGLRHSCALNVEGNVLCWGASPGGERGDGTMATTITPTAVGAAPDVLAGVDHIATYRDFTCALTGGDATCWGIGGDGQMGDGTFMGRLTPGASVRVAGITRLAAGSIHACAITAGGLACWGGSYNGQAGPLGSSGYGASNKPVAIPLGGATAIDLAAGDAHTCALLDDHTVTCWGDDRAGQLGDGVRDKQTRVAPHLPCP